MKLLRKMIQIRCFENKVSELRKEIKGPIHSCVGQEAVSVGVCSALGEKDYIIGNHRSHGHQIAKGANMNKLMAKIFKGNGGSMHVADKSVGGILTTAIVGSGLPVACGVAFASKYLKTDRIVCVFFGDGAVSEGSFHESLNLASQWRLPVLFVLENNGVAVTTMTKQYNYYRFAESYGISSAEVGGQKVKSVYEATKTAINMIHNTGMPYLLEAVTCRFHEHQEGAYYEKMKDTGYRDVIELEHCEELYDPIKLHTRNLVDKNILSYKEVNNIFDEEIINVENAVKFASQ